MADAVTSQTLADGDKIAVVKINKYIRWNWRKFSKEN
jgi:hypothetical protein